MKKILALLTAIILLSSLVLAYNGYYRRGYSFLPEDILENEWFMFGLILMGFFAIIFFALSKSMRENLGAAVVISLVISLFAALAISQKVKFYGLVGETIGGWAIAIIVVALVILLIKGAISSGGFMLFLGLFIINIFLNIIDLYDYLPYSILDSPMMGIHDFVASGLFLGILIILFIILLFSKRAREWLFPKREEREIKIPIR